MNHIQGKFTHCLNKMAANNINNTDGNTFHNSADERKWCQAATDPQIKPIFSGYSS